ncbi:MAG TPA: dienelactone hydrolase family protein [Terriglobales bacterium]|nr:dienelactone hydrolase family protein [Terriglobales bacterium]
MRALRLLLLLAAAASLLSAQQWAKSRLEQSPRHREIVRIVHGGRTLSAFVAYPQASGPRPVVLVIHEIFGLSDWAQEVTDELAAAGYVAIAPDLLSGEGPGGGGTESFSGQTAIGRAISRLPPAQITADLNAAADWALKQPASNGKLYVVGFCWGGGQSFRFATQRRGLAADFVFYGVPPARAAMARITAPVFGFYAGDDARISLTVPATRAAMKALGKKYAAVIYPGAGHGFMRAGEQPDPTPANQKARAAAWARLLQLLRR